MNEEVRCSSDSVHASFCAKRVALADSMSNLVVFTMLVEAGAFSTRCAMNRERRLSAVTMPCTLQNQKGSTSRLSLFHCGVRDIEFQNSLNLIFRPRG